MDLGLESVGWYIVRCVGLGDIDEEGLLGGQFRWWWRWYWCSVRGGRHAAQMGYDLSILGRCLVLGFGEQREELGWFHIRELFGCLDSSLFALEVNFFG